MRSILLISTLAVVASLLAASPSSGQHSGDVSVCISTEFEGTDYDNYECFDSSPIQRTVQTTTGRFDVRWQFNGSIDVSSNSFDANLSGTLTIAKEAESARRSVEADIGVVVAVQGSSGWVVVGGTTSASISGDVQLSSPQGDADDAGLFVTNSPSDRRSECPPGLIPCNGLSLTGAVDFERSAQASADLAVDRLAPADQATSLEFVLEVSATGSFLECVAGSCNNPSGQGLIVNRSDDSEDANAGDGTCDTDLAQSGDQCTLRAALQEANLVSLTEPAPRIRFVGPLTIRPASPLPTITRDVDINATNQSGAVILDGGLTTGTVSGLLVAADNVTVKGLTITDFGGFGIDVVGGADVTLAGNAIGIGTAGTNLPNTLGAIRVVGSDSDVTIGSLNNVNDQNAIHGPIIIPDDARARVYLNTMSLAVEDTQGLALRSLVDLGDDGPSCGTWARTSDSRPAPPRVLELSTTRVRGLASPDDVVIAYKVDELGSGNGRYWARSVSPLNLGTADGTGAFDIPYAFTSGDRIVLMAVSSDGRTSEMSQARRPVIFAPGIGGTWLQDSSDEYLWLPAALSSGGKNERLARLGMQPDGTTSIESVSANEVVEFAGLAIYGPIHEMLAGEGYVGDPLNEQPATLDQWRFPNDWRMSGAQLANNLRQLVDQVTGASGQSASSPARSCQVDIVSHSNGGVIAATYLRANAVHASNRVHRFVTSGTPYLGADQAYAAHANGYVFGVDEVLPSLSFLNLGYVGPWEVAWGDMLEMTKNVPGAYGLLPSRAYFDAMDEATPTYSHGYGIVDLYNIPVDGYDQTVDFLTRKKLDDIDVPSGLGRNADIWQDQQTAVHDLIDDWRTYEGPPHIFRHVGVLSQQTEVGWFMGPGPEYLTESETSRSEAGDTDRHRAYRERLRPIMGLGDKTVPLLSASLGRRQDVGKADFSGVDESPWIEEFEYFECAHGKLVEDNCRPTAATALALGSDPDALERIAGILSSGSMVPVGSTNRSSSSPSTGLSQRGESAIDDGARAAFADADSAEVIYVMASAPVAVVLTDAAGRRTGSTDADHLDEVSYDIPGIAYNASRFGATFSLPTDSSYTAIVTAVDPVASITLLRQSVGGGSASQLVYPTQTLDPGGTLSFALSAGGTPEQATWEKDTDGDGATDDNVGPAVVVEATSAVPAIPFPQPTALEATTPSNADRQSLALAIPNTGTAGWTFTISTDVPWISLETESGTVPATIGVELDPAGLSDGRVTTSLSLTLANGGYEYVTAIPVTFHVGVATSVDDEEKSRGGFELAVAPNPANAQTTVRFGVEQAGDVNVSVYDVLGRQVSVLHDGPRASGLVTLPVSTDSLPTGVYFVRMTAEGVVETTSFTIAR